MIYFDHAATSYPKSAAIHRAVREALVRYGGNPGRGGYAMAIDTSEMMFSCRETVARAFGVCDPSQVVFTLNCTAALNIAVHSLFADGGRVVVSDLEHNAVIRPLYADIPLGIDTAHVTPYDAAATVTSFERAITPQTKAIVCTHASNVIGCALPIRELAALSHRYGIPLIVDAAQSAGYLPIDLENDGADIVCLAGHKGIGGPMGTGMLLCRRPMALRPLMQGGTGSASKALFMPDEWPERLESGTPNVVGISGLQAAVARLGTGGISAASSKAWCLCRRLYQQMRLIEGVTLYSPCPQAGESVPVLSFRIAGLSVAETCEALWRFGIAARGGLHCAPAAHRAIGTLDEGTVRFSLGAGNDEKEIGQCVQILKKIVKNPLCFRSGYGKIQ